jgi:Pentapeptide repeats (8 copies)
LRADLIDANLSLADLSGANLSGASLQYAYLSGANVSGAWLDQADVSGAHLFRADLNGVNLSRANLSEAELAYLSLVDTDIETRPASGLRPGASMLRRSSAQSRMASPVHAVSISVSFDTGRPRGSTSTRNSPTARGASATGSPRRRDPRLGIEAEWDKGVIRQRRLF